MALDIIILAAGKGSRMKSNKPKVLHELAGVALLGHVIATSRELSPASITVVIGHEAGQVREYFADAEDIQWVEQTEQLGTGHAVLQAIPALNPEHDALVLYGDVPLIKPETLTSLLALSAPLKLLTAIAENPFGYGRIVREGEEIVAIVEEKDANAQEKAINEINTGILAAPVGFLQQQLPKLSSDNAQAEYYLTDIVGVAAANSVAIEAAHPASETETLGVNDRCQLATVERIYQHNLAQTLMKAGVAISDPNRIDIRGTLTCGAGVYIDPNVIFEGDVILGDGVTIESNTIIRDSEIAAGTQVLSHSVIEGAKVARQVAIGPFARLRPGSELKDGSKVGNFVEMKKSSLGAGAKINHLSYVGDAIVGDAANVGAGTITCNYDGVNKHKTEIGAGAFIGSNSSLVAPVSIGNGATVGAGSVITNNVDENHLAVARAKARTIKDWPRPQKKT